jgi:hypothetical protein
MSYSNAPMGSTKHGRSREGTLLDIRCLNEIMKASTNIETTHEPMFSLQWNRKR